MNQLSFLRWLVILNGGVPLLMLIYDAGTGQLGANSVNQALHITGILSLTFLLLSLVMTPLRWLTKCGGWIAFRRALGLYGFFYAIAHLVIYLYFDRALNLSSAVHEIWMRRFLQVGSVAVLLMVPLAVTSTNGMIRRIGPKRWKQLHRLTYLVVILGVLHYYMLVKSDVRQPLAFAGVLTVLLGGRFGRRYFEQPTKLVKAAHQSASQKTTDTVVRQQWKGTLRIAELIQETHDVRTFRLVNPDGGELPFEYMAGQFINVQLMIDGKRVNRSYTLASSPTNREHCELTTKRESLGLASRFMHDTLKVGDELSMSGPAGKFVFTDRTAGGALLIAGGVGITPVMSILRTLIREQWTQPIFFLFAAKTERDLIFRQELEQLSRDFPHLQVLITLTRETTNGNWSGLRGRIDAELLSKHIPTVHQLPVFLCGPNEMMDFVRGQLVSLNVPTHQIHTEAFGGTKSKAAGESNSTASFVNAMTAPAAGSSTTEETGEGMLATIRFLRSGRVVRVESDQSILEAAEQCGLDIPFECRSGICGQCKVQLVTGNVRMNCEDALSKSEKQKNIILACQAQPISETTIDA